MKYFFITLISFTIFSIKLQAQKPLLLESIQQHYNDSTQTWSDDIKYNYSYDQKGNIIQQTRKNLAACLEDCPDYSTWEFAQVNEYWKYNTKNQVEWNYIESWTYHRQNVQDPWELDISSKTTRTTRYNEDSLILYHETMDEYPAIEEWQVAYTSTNIQQFEYNKYRKPVLQLDTYEYKSDLNQSGTIEKTIYIYNGELKTSQKLTYRNYSDGDTIFAQNSTIQYFYLSNGQIDYSLSELDWNNYQDIPSYYKGKQTYTYNIQNQLEREDRYNWDFNTLAWELISYTSYSYNTTGILKESEERILKDENGNIQINRYTYDEAGKVVLIVNELYDQNELFVKELFRSFTTWYDDKSYKSITSSENGISSYLFYSAYNSENKLLIQDFEFVNYDPDSLFLGSSLTKSIYSYDQSGYLVQINETRISYDQDSLISTGCCGFLYESEEIFDNRCDGVALTSTREQWNYIPGTTGEFAPQAMRTRQLNQYSRTLCVNDEIASNSLVLYPNPTTGAINIISDLFTAPNTNITLVSLEGKIIKSTLAPLTKEINMDLTGLASGIYILKLSNSDGHSEGRIALTP